MAPRQPSALHVGQVPRCSVDAAVTRGLLAASSVAWAPLRGSGLGNLVSWEVPFYARFIGNFLTGELLSRKHLLPAAGEEGKPAVCALPGRQPP